jgi:hypothetical protein
VRYRAVQNNDEGNAQEPDLESHAGKVFVFEVLQSNMPKDMNNRNHYGNSAHTVGKDKEGFQCIVR